MCPYPTEKEKKRIKNEIKSTPLNAGREKNVSFNIQKLCEILSQLTFSKALFPTIEQATDANCFT